MVLIGAHSIHLKQQLNRPFRCEEKLSMKGSSIKSQKFASVDEKRVSIDPATKEFRNVNPLN